ncbi:MAG: ATP-dependent helicase [Mycoplasma sp.]
MKVKLEKLNKKQHEAVVCDLKPTMVIAGAGSGKTSVLTTRFEFLTKEKNIKPNEILTITFTNKAAEEMKERIISKVGENHQFWIGTFHSICLKILKEDIDKSNCGLNEKFKIIDDNETNQILKGLRTKFVNKTGTDKIKLTSLKKIIEEVKTNEMDINEIKKNKIQVKFDIEYCDIENIIEIVKNYDIECKRNNYIDFNDMLIMTNQLLEDKNVAAKWQQKFKTILVDEFQDTNLQQFNLIKKLLNKGKSIFIVGDPDQMIYTWRGAKSKILDMVKKEFGKMKQIILDINYRSDKEIIEKSNNLIKNNKNRIEKQLIANSKNDGIVGVKNYYNSWEEGKRVVQEINKKIRSGYLPKDICLLYRSKVLLRFFEGELIKNKIPYIIHGNVSFFERQEVKDVISYIYSKINGDFISINRAIQIPKRDIGESTLEKIKTWAYENNKTYKEAMQECHNIKGITPKKCERIKDFIKEIEDINLNEPIDRIIDKIWINSGLKSIYENSIEEDKIDRNGNIETLKDISKVYQLENSQDKIWDWLRETSIRKPQESTESVQLMTIHKAKGLEWKTVFVVGLNEGIFPSKKTIEDDKEDMGIEEERRLAYVAFTRAREELFLTYVESINTYDCMMEGEISRFIKEAYAR